MSGEDESEEAPLRVLSIVDRSSTGGGWEDADSFEQELEAPVEDDQVHEGSVDAAGKRIALVGRFGSMNRRQATNVLESYQAIMLDLGRLEAKRQSDPSPPARQWLDWIVIGAEESMIAQSELVETYWIEAAARGEIEILPEMELWQRLGLIDVEESARRYYTPAMLAELLDVSVRVIRRWHRRGLITPAMTLHRLPFFDYAEVTSAKRLAGWITAGASPKLIEKRLVELVQVFPGVQRPLDQLSILVEGKHVLLRQGAGLVEPGGQMRFDFDATGAEPDDDGSILSFERPDQPPMLRAVAPPVEDELLVAAYQAEDADDLETAIDLYHTILARDGARADVSFQIAELLYRMNSLMAARERYYSAIELDPEFVEARASLGAVLSELGQDELAIAALRGALSLFEDYVDAHYTLAKVLDKLDRGETADAHWKRVIELAPASPWASEADVRLSE